MKPAACCALLLLTACADFQKLAQLKPRKVTMRVNDQMTDATGKKVKVPLPKAGLKPCRAWVDVALNEGWKKIEGEWVADGECVLHDVPPGVLLVSIAQSERSSWVTMPVDDFDLGFELAGRPAAVAGVNTTVTVDLSATAPLSTLNWVSMYLPDFHQGLFNSSGGGNPAIGTPKGMTGATAFPVTFDWSGLPITEPAEDVVIYQSVAPSADSLNFVLTKVGVAHATPVSGKNVRATAVMADLPTRPPGFPTFTLKPDAWYSAIKADMLNPVFFGAFVTQDAVLPGVYLGVATQLTFTLNESADITIPANARDPLPGRPWEQRLTIFANFQSTLTRNSGRTGELLLGFEMEGPANDTTWTASAQMSPVRDIVAVKPDGTVVSESGSIDTTGPTLRWDPPQVGIPNYYTVNAYEVVEDPLDDKKLTFQKYPANFHTEKAEIHIPPGLLKAQTNYVFTVLANNCFAGDSAHPNQRQRQTRCGLSENRSVQFTTGN